MLPLLKLDNWAKEFPYMDPLKRVRLLGGLGMRIMGVPRILHWELRQSVEGYLGFVLQSILNGAYPCAQLPFESALLAIGIEVEPTIGAGTLALTDIDLHHKGVKLTRFAITDRWGMYREFAEDGTHLHARVCHNMRTKGGCPRYLDFAGCGCACPYLHARSSELGKWLTRSARDEIRKAPTPWDRALALKDAQGRLLNRGLPYVDGFCVTISAWRQLCPTHQAPAKHKELTQQEKMVTVDAFDRQTMNRVREVRRGVSHAFDLMRTNW